MTPILRVARPTRDLDALVPFYRDGLGFDIISSFQDHQLFDGVMFGHAKAPYHLEFTQDRNNPEADIGAPSPEHLLVFYYPEKQEWEDAVKKMEDAGFKSVESHNPYWNVSGRTYEDPDGYRVVLQQAGWTK